MTAGSNCISKEEARRFLVKYHGLDGGQGWSGKDGIMRFMNRVGCIQYDPLNGAECGLNIAVKNCGLSAQAVGGAFVYGSEPGGWL